MLFSDIARFDESPKRVTETDIAFLDRSPWPAVARVRQLLEDCLAHYPATDAEELCSRMRSGDSRHFDSASFELLLHEYMRRLGFRLTPHPVLPNGSATRPDFLVECADTQTVYLEAVTASDDNGRDPAAEARKATALQILDSEQHPSFMVTVDSEGSPTTQPSGRKLANAVIAWLNSLKADELLVAAQEDYEQLPQLTWQHEEWHVRVRAIPVNPDARGRSRRLIGARDFGAGWVDSWSPIRDAVLTKSRKYGELELPLVVAVNVDTFNLDPIDEAQALFGQEQFVFNRSNPDAEPRFERAPNGAWRGASGPRGRRASGAWLFNNLSPYTLARRNHTLYVNPWANLPLPESFLAVPHATVVEGYLRRSEGTGIHTAFGLPPTWPE